MRAVNAIIRKVVFSGVFLRYVEITLLYLLPSAIMTSYDFPVNANSTIRVFVSNGKIEVDTDKNIKSEN